MDVRSLLVRLPKRAGREVIAGAYELLTAELTQELIQHLGIGLILCTERSGMPSRYRASVPRSCLVLDLHQRLDPLPSSSDVASSLSALTDARRNPAIASSFFLAHLSLNA